MSLSQNLIPPPHFIEKAPQSSIITTQESVIHQTKQLTKKLSLKQSIKNIFKFFYFNAFILIISALCNSMIGVSFATINDEVSEYYSISTKLVSFCALEFLFINPIVSIFANYILDNKGLKLGISIGCVLNIIAVFLRTFINHSFVFVIVGNAFSAMGNIFIINCPARFSAVWFKPQERIIITTLIAFANAVSGQIGAIMSPYFVQNGLTPEQGRNSILRLITFQTVLISSVMMANLILFRGIPGKSSSSSSLQEKIKSIKISLFEESRQQNQLDQVGSSQPQSHPQQTHQHSSHYRHARYFNQLKQLFTTPNYLLALVGFSFIASVLNSFATNVELYIIPFGLTKNDAGNLTIVSVVTGLVGAIGSSLIIKKIKKFKVVILTQIFLSIIFSLLLIYSLAYSQIWLLYFSIAMFSLLLYPLFPAITQYCCQFMSPIRQSTVMGFLIGIAQLISFAMVLAKFISKGMIQTVLLETKTKQNVMACLAMNCGCYTVALIALFVTKQKLKRLNRNP